MLDVRAARSARRSLAAALALAGAALIAAGCGGGGSGGGDTPTTAKAANDRTPVTINVWSGFTARELGVLDSVLDDFHRTHPWITIKSVGGISDDKMIAAIRGGHPPDLSISFSTDNVGSFCGSGAWQDLGERIKADKVDIGAFPKAVQDYTQYQGKRCAMPVLADVYGLYYNKKMFAKAGITSPPKTISELTADAKKLTQRDGKGNLKVVGYNPFYSFYENVATNYSPLFAAEWMDPSGQKSYLGKNPGWQTYFNWTKDLVDYYGYDKIVRFNAGAGDEFSASNAFETGKLAMAIDGEYRTAFIKAEHPELDYATAPMPVADDHPELYGAGQVTGTLAGVPRGAKHPDAAWELLKYIATDTGALVKLSNGLHNVPTTKASLESSSIVPDPHFKPFLAIMNHPKTSHPPILSIGSANQELVAAFATKWQAGKIGNLADGLNKVDQQIDAQIENTNAGQAP
jgi:multiple sugar transport system substrate-binding protein